MSFPLGPSPSSSFIRPVTLPIRPVTLATDVLLVDRYHVLIPALRFPFWILDSSRYCLRIHLISFDWLAIC